MVGLEPSLFGILRADTDVEILEIEKGASKIEIKKAYHKVLEHSHPLCCVLNRLGSAFKPSGQSS